MSCLEDGRKALVLRPKQISGDGSPGSFGGVFFIPSALPEVADFME